MKIENSFEVAAPAEEAWALLMDVPRVIPCMPGAELTETLDADRWKAKMSVKLGPISLVFATDVARESTDEAARTSTLSANARELKGRGSARATIESRLADVDGGTRVEVVTDLSLTGPVAQYGRGMVADVAAQLTRQFADCLQQQLSAPADEPAAPPAQARPVSGLRLGLGALVRALGRLLRLRRESQ
ncbi:MAG TPA: SRPBCC family protein [Gaiellaceae bacterium]